MKTCGIWDRRLKIGGAKSNVCTGMSAPGTCWDGASVRRRTEPVARYRDGSRRVEDRADSLEQLVHQPSVPARVVAREHAQQACDSHREQRHAVELAGVDLRLAGLRGGDDNAWIFRTIAYEPLVRWTRDWTGVIPNVAESWEVNDDATEFTFKLREGMKWSDGEPFTSADVMFWY